jgi:3-methyladenine DNA glycosylase/8-oxoguanine DNA glycosylase
MRRTLRPPTRVSLRLTLGPARPRTTVFVGDDVGWRATRTPEGPATVALVERRSTGTIDVTAWGPGAAWALEHAEDLVGVHDRTDDFAPPGGSLVDQLWRRFEGLRIPRTRAVWEAALPAVLEQKVIGKEARRSYADLVRRHGEPAPGPAGVAGRPRWLRLPPSAESVAALPAFAFPPLGVEAKRAATLRRVAADGARLERLPAVPLPEAHRRLQTIAGVGRWTSAEIALVALGDADAVSVGDYHLPNLVSWALAGEARGTDARMLELLEPYRGHRGRVIRLLERGVRHAPRFGPRSTLRTHVGG